MLHLFIAFGFQVSFLGILWGTLWVGRVSSPQVGGSALSTVPYEESSILWTVFLYCNNTIELLKMLRDAINIICRLWGAEETTRISLILWWGEYKTQIVQHIFVFILISFFNNLKWMRPVVCFHLCPSALKYTEQITKTISVVKLC